jgi:hypothetical protein
MFVTHEIGIDCSEITPEACSDSVLTGLEHGSGFKLRADTLTDVVNGSVSIVHNDQPGTHVIEIELYEVRELPTAHWENGQLVGRQSTLEPAPNRVSRESLIKRLETAFS